MNNDLESIIKILGIDFLIEFQSRKIGDFIHHNPLSSKELNVLSRYSDYRICQIIELIRIERLFELGLISLEEKQILIKEYNEYFELVSIISQFDIKKIIGEIDENEKLDKNIYLRKDEIFNKLNFYGILEEFHFEEVIIREVDSKIKRIKR